MWSVRLIVSCKTEDSWSDQLHRVLSQLQRVSQGSDRAFLMLPWMDGSHPWHVGRQAWAGPLWVLLWGVPVAQAAEGTYTSG